MIYRTIGVSPASGTSAQRLMLKYLVAKGVPVSLGAWHVFKVLLVTPKEIDVAASSTNFLKRQIVYNKITENTSTNLSTQMVQRLMR